MSSQPTGARGLATMAQSLLQHVRTAQNTRQHCLCGKGFCRSVRRYVAKVDHHVMRNERSSAPSAKSFSQLIPEQQREALRSYFQFYSPEKSSDAMLDSILKKCEANMTSYGKRCRRSMAQAKTSIPLLLD